MAGDSSMLIGPLITPSAAAFIGDSAMLVGDVITPSAARMDGTSAMLARPRIVPTSPPVETFRLDAVLATIINNLDAVLDAETVLGAEVS